MFLILFYDCIGALDGAHIDTMVQGPVKASHRNRKIVLERL